MFCGTPCTMVTFMPFRFFQILHACFKVHVHAASDTLQGQKLLKKESDVGMLLSGEQSTETS